MQNGIMLYKHFPSLLFKIQQLKGNSTCFHVGKHSLKADCAVPERDDRFQFLLDNIMLNIVLPPEQQYDLHPCR